MEYDIIGLGVATIDDLLVLGEMPRPNHKQRVLAKTRQCGGLTCSALVAAARLGARCGYIATLGDGELSGFLREALRRENIDLYETESDGEVEPYHSVILIEKASGERSILADDSRSRPPRFGRKEREVVASARCLYVDHVYAAAIYPEVEAARKRGVDVVGDFERNSPGSVELMAATNHLILPLGYARELFGDSASAGALAERLARSPGRSVACVTDGIAGAWWAVGEAPSRVSHQAVFPMPRTVDTTGCGDVFHGAYAAGLVQGLPPEERFRNAAAAAALKTQHPGAQAGTPTRAELESFLSERLR